MGLENPLWRRWLGAIVLGAALVMLVAGETVWKSSLAGLAFLLYWLACFGLTALAALIALLDARALQRRARQQKRQLLATALKDIQLEAQARAQGQPPEKKN